MSRGLFAPDAPPFRRFARVVLERGIDHPDGLTYGVPDAVAELAVGDRVEAPLGKHDARATGYVVEIITEPGLDPAKIKPIRRRTGVGLPPSLMALADWVARYYCTPLGMTLSAMTPGAVKLGVGVRKRVEVEPTGGALPADLKVTPTLRAAIEAISRIPANEFPMRAKDIAIRAGLRSVAPINRLLRAGALREVERSTVRAAWGDRPIPADAPVTLTPEQARATGAIVASLRRFQPFLLRGVTASGKTEVYLRAIGAALDRGESALVLVPEISLTPQTVGRFRARFDSWRGLGGERANLAVLHSGLTAAQRSQQWSAVASGAARIVIGARSAVFAPFPESVRLGLVIVDEEHEDGYKQDQLPRYHGRDVAIKRAQIAGCPIVLGSATPSLESWRNASEGRFTLLELPDRVGGASLPRVEVVDLAQERRARPWTDQRVHLLGPRLERAIGETLDANGQVILLLNRRGWGNYICCPDHRCGWVLSCESCDAAMVYHRERLPAPGMPAGLVRCHHCLAERVLPSLCPVCRKRATVFGMGTQRVEDELARLFPVLVTGETMLRLDSDTIASGGAGGRKWFDALERFARGDIRLLLGTQMIAKGLDFPGVRLVGVVNADTALTLPDFRAAERTYQMVNQVCGRTGRPGASDPGLAIVQTFTPLHPAIQLAARHDYIAFAAGEMESRRRVGLPPFTRMARIVVRDKSNEKAWAHANEVEQALREAMSSGTRGGPPSEEARRAIPTAPDARRDREGAFRAGADSAGVNPPSGVRLRGPMPCPIARIHDFHRIAIELLAESAGEIQRVITHARNRGLLKSDARTAVDVDPVMML